MGVTEEEPLSFRVMSHQRTSESESPVSAGNHNVLMKSCCQKWTSPPPKKQSYRERNWSRLWEPCAGVRQRLLMAKFPWVSARMDSLHNTRGWAVEAWRMLISEERNVKWNAKESKKERGWERCCKDEAELLCEDDGRQRPENSKPTFIREKPKIGCLWASRAKTYWQQALNGPSDLQSCTFLHFYTADSSSEG